MASNQGILRFQNKTAIVTASTDGIGLAIARRLAEEGAYVVISSRKQENVDRALATFKKDGLVNVSGLVCDAGSKSDRDALINHTLDKSSGIDILVSNVAVAPGSSILNAPEEEWDQIMDLNLKSHYLLTKEVAPHIKKQGKGSIVYITSIAAYLPLGGIYSISKAGLVQLTKVAATQLAPMNIRVNAIAPGLIETEMAKMAHETPAVRKQFEDMSMLKRIGQPKEIAGVAAFLCSEDASYVTGETIIAAGGTHCRV